jgi:hypothetical protein
MEREPGDRRALATRQGQSGRPRAVHAEHDGFPAANRPAYGAGATGGWDSGWIGLYEMLANDFLYPDPGRLVVFAENHDSATRARPPRRRRRSVQAGDGVYRHGARQPAVLLRLGSAGAGPRERNDGELRADMPGGWAGDAGNAFTGKGLSPAQRDAQQYVRTLFNWRKRSPVVQHGKLQHFAPADGVYVYFRYARPRTR